MQLKSSRAERWVQLKSTKRERHPATSQMQQDR